VKRETRISVPSSNRPSETLTRLQRFERRRSSPALPLLAACLAPFNGRLPSLIHKRVKGIRDRVWMLALRSIAKTRATDDLAGIT
jgi:hypothetical protein